MIEQIQIPKYHKKKRTNMTGVGFVIKIVVLAILCISCSCLYSNGQNEEKAEKLKKATIAPSITPEGTVKTLYSDTIFFNLRNAIPPDVIAHLSPCITTELKTHFESHNEDIEAWMRRNKNSGLKLPVGEGPIFLSNYEGADLYQVGKANINGRFAKVPVSLSITDVMGEFQWVDIVLLRQVGNVWLLENIMFQSGSDKNHTLLNRVSLIE
jgi:hypothetical protein